jgi:hypothetical protein
VTYGLLSQKNSTRLIRRLQRGRVDDIPDTPWCAIARESESSVVFAVSTMFGSGLFWSRGPRGAAVATDPRWCAALSGLRLTPNSDYLHGFVSGSPPPTATPYAGVHRIGCGSLTRWHFDHEPITTYFSGPDVWPEPHLRGRAAKDAFTAAFDNCLRELQQFTRTPVVAMSAGLDSTFLVGSMAGQRHTDDPAIRAFVYRPIPQAHRANTRHKFFNEWELATAVEDMYPNLVDIRPVSNTALVTPRDAAKDAAARSGVIASTPTNQIWLSAIRDRARAADESIWFSGSHGNAAFSGRHLYAWRYHKQHGQWRDLAHMTHGRAKNFGPMNAIKRLLKEPPPATPAAPPNLLVDFGLAPFSPPETHGDERQNYLMWLARRHRIPIATNPAGTQGCLLTDPFSSREVLSVAAQITPAERERTAVPRGWARDVGRGRVPDAIRTNTARGVQGWDAWYPVRNLRRDYLKTLKALADVDWLPGLDQPRLVQHVDRWPWGQPEGPPLNELIAIERLLATSDFAHTAYA